MQYNQIIRFLREVSTSRFCTLVWCLFFVCVWQKKLHGEQVIGDDIEQTILDHLQEADKNLSVRPDDAYRHINIATQIATESHLLDKYIFDFTQYKVRCAKRHYQTDSMYYFLKDADTELRKLPDSLQGEIELFLLKKWRDYYYITGNWGKALQKIEALHPILEKDIESYPDVCKSFMVNVVYRGNIEMRKNNYDLAIKYFRYAFKYVETMKKLKGVDYTDRLNLHLASAYKNKGEYTKSIVHYLKSNESYQKRIIKKPKLKNSLLNNYNNIAALYLEMNQPDSALLYLNQSIEHHIKDDPFYATTWLNIGKAFTQKGDYTQAADYMNQALNLTQNRYGNKHYKTAQVYLEIGKVYQEKQDFETALKHYQKSVVSLVAGYEDTSIYGLPTMLDVNNKKELLLALQAKANAFHALWLQDENIENLKHADAHIQLAANVMDDIRREYSSEEARQFLIEQNYPIFEKGIEINRQLYLQTNDENHLAEAFRMAEKSKSLSLLDALKNTDAQQFANIPKDTLEQERQLRTQITHLKGKISKIKKGTKNENKLRELQNELFEQQQHYDTFVAQLEAKYPDYHNLKYGQSIAGIDEIRRDILSHDVVFVEYFMGDEQLYAFFITKNKIHLSATPNTKQIQANISELRQAINEANDVSYVQTARFLYQNLLEEGLEKMGESVERIIVVPDGGLAYIPFDILLENKIESNDEFTYRRDIMPYLINSYAISYAYSATVLQQNLNKQKSNRNEHDFVGFAPDFSRSSEVTTVTRSCHDNSLISLPNSKYEVEEIHQLIGGKIFTETAATKANFVDLGTKSRLIHLSTHACADEDDQLSRIYFNDSEYLTALELYPLRLDADMVVLSACETGIGTLRRGEGVMSLARAFAYTGVPATTMSLWSVDDNATSKIMVHYYKHLKSGKTKDQALRAAKLDFLDEDVVNPRHQAPYYWAAFVHIGNAEALEHKTNWWLWLSALALIIGGISIRQYYQRR